jgi:hypothetical protein
MKGAMSSPLWATWSAVVDSKVGGRIRDLMKEAKGFDCLTKDLDATEKEAKKKEWDEIKQSNQYQMYKVFFESECFTAAEKIPKVNYFMTALAYGTPLTASELTEADEGKPDPEKKYPSDSDTVIAFLKDLISHVKETHDESDTGVKVRVDGIVLALEDFIGLALSDTMKALFSVTFVFLYLNFHLQSCILSCLGMGIIIFSFPFTVIITNAIFQIKYFGFL